MIEEWLCVRRLAEADADSCRVVCRGRSATGRERETRVARAPEGSERESHRRNDTPKNSPRATLTHMVCVLLHHPPRHSYVAPSLLFTRARLARVWQGHTNITWSPSLKERLLVGPAVCIFFKCTRLIEGCRCLEVCCWHFVLPTG